MAKQRIEDNKRKSNEWQEFFNEFANNTGHGSAWDRSVAILGAAFLDEQLRQLLNNYFIPNEKIRKRLLEDVVSEFSSRTHLAFAVGLIGERMHGDLLQIGEIRNCFAHDLHNRNFTDSDISAKCQNLQASEIFAKGFTAAIDNPRQKFTTSVTLITSQLGLGVVAQQDKGGCKIAKDFSVAQVLSV